MMMTEKQVELAPLFQAVGQALEHNRSALNLADPHNGNHGDHMVQIFRLASQAADEMRNMPMAETMEHVADMLWELNQNGSAQEYARGLSCMAEQFRKYDISLENLVSYIRGVLVEGRNKPRTQEISHDHPGSREGWKHSDSEKMVPNNLEASSAKSAEVLKALASGLAAWGQEDNGRTRTVSPLDMGRLFEFGMAYLQARQRGGSKIEVLADAAASVAPLSKVPHRCQSGKLAIQAFLQAMQVGSTGLAE